MQETTASQGAHNSHQRETYELGPLYGRVRTQREQSVIVASLGKGGKLRVFLCEGGASMLRGPAGAPAVTDKLPAQLGSLNIDWGQLSQVITLQGPWSIVGKHTLHTCFSFFWNVLCGIIDDSSQQCNFQRITTDEKPALCISRSALQGILNILKLLNLDRDSKISVSISWQHVTW